MSENRKVYILSEDEIEALVKSCAGAGVEAYQKEYREQCKRDMRHNDPARRMKEKLSCYRRVKKTIEDEKEYTAQEKYEYRLKFLEDLMGDPIKSASSKTEQILLDREEKRRQDQYSIRQIDRALALYREECEESGNEEYKRRCRALERYYIDSPGMSVDEIAALENVSVNTVYRDINIACGIMYQYVVGM